MEHEHGHEQHHYNHEQQQYENDALPELDESVEEHTEQDIEQQNTDNHKQGYRDGEVIDYVKRTDWITVPEMAALLDVSETTIRRWLKGSGLQAWKFAGKLRISKQQFEALIYDDLEIL